jgi:hypothetical protein
MANTIILKKSSVAGKVPLATDLAYGELAINYTDGKLYFKKSDNSITSILSGLPADYVARSGDTMTGPLAIGNGIITDSTPALSLSQTWNSGTTTFTAATLNVTDNASASGSLLLDLQVAGSSKVKASKGGQVFASHGGDYAPAYGFVGFNASLGITARTEVPGIYLNYNGWPGFRYRADENIPSATTFGFYTGGWTNNSSVFITSDGANIIAQRNGTNAQTFRVYNTYTDSSNYETAVIDWSTSSNVLSIGTKAVGTGTLRNIALIGGNVGIGTSTPTTKLDVVGSIKVNTSVTLNAEASTVAATTQTQIASFAIASFRSAKLLIQVYDTVAGTSQVSELLVTHNGTTAYATEYGVVYTGTTAIASFDVDILSGNLRLLATRSSANSTQYKVSETLISV